MKVQIISIGNELLIGDTVNTNAAWLGTYLTELGFEVEQVSTIGDEAEKIKKSVAAAMEASGLVICTGGLGPTHDDITKKAVAELFKSNLKVNEEVLEFITERFRKWKIPMSQSNYEQALTPENAELLFNDNGTAPGMWFKREKSYLAVLPGVPSEMKYLMKKRVTPKLNEVFGDIGVLHSIYLKAAGIGESTLSDDVLGDLSAYLNEKVSLAFLPNLGEITLRINSRGDNLDEAKNNAQPLYKEIRKKAGEYIFGEGKEVELPQSVGELLEKRKETFATAESCTGGLISDAITNVAGSSAYFVGGVVSYSNMVKIEQLGVSEETIAQKGAVSKEVALQMAKNVAEKLKADIGISATGIAGPGGGTQAKPVGTVWIGFYSKEEHFAVLSNFSGDRQVNKRRTMLIGFDIIRRVLCGISEMPYGLKKHTL